MPSYSKLAIATLATAALASPIERANKRGITVNQDVARKLPAGVVQYANTYRKYGKAPPEHVERAAQASGGTSGVTANPESGDVSYLCSVNIGGQTLSLDFDTGSADL